MASSKLDASVLVSSLENTMPSSQSEAILMLSGYTRKHYTAILNHCNVSFKANIKAEDMRRKVISAIRNRQNSANQISKVAKPGSDSNVLPTPTEDHLLHLGAIVETKQVMLEDLFTVLHTEQDCKINKGIKSDSLNNFSDLPFQFTQTGRGLSKSHMEALRIDALKGDDLTSRKPIDVVVLDDPNFPDLKNTYLVIDGNNRTRMLLDSEYADDDPLFTPATYSVTVNVYHSDCVDKVLAFIIGTNTGDSTLAPKYNAEFWDAIVKHPVFSKWSAKYIIERYNLTGQKLNTVQVALGRAFKRNSIVPPNEVWGWNSKAQKWDWINVTNVRRKVKDFTPDPETDETPERETDDTDDTEIENTMPAEIVEGSERITSIAVSGRYFAALVNGKIMISEKSDMRECFSLTLKELDAIAAMVS